MTRGARRQSSSISSSLVAREDKTVAARTPRASGRDELYIAESFSRTNLHPESGYRVLVVASGLLLDLRGFRDKHPLDYTNISR